MDYTLAKRIKEDNIKLHGSPGYALEYDRICGIISHPWERKVFYSDIAQIDTMLDNKDINVLDIGCGTGNLSLILLEKGYNVTGVDISESMLSVLKRHTAKKGFDSRLNAVQDDIDNYIRKCKTTYQLICFSSVLHHLPDYLTTLKDCCSLIATGGIIYIIHEPSLMKNVSMSARLLERTDKIIYEMKIAIKRQIHRVIEIGLIKTIYHIYEIKCRRQQVLSMQKPNENLADYYAKHGGCSEEEILKLLEAHGFSVYFEKYDSKRSKIMHFIAKTIKTKRIIKIIAKKVR